MCAKSLKSNTINGQGKYPPGSVGALAEDYHADMESEKTIDLSLEDGKIKRLPSHIDSADLSFLNKNHSFPLKQLEHLGGQGRRQGTLVSRLKNRFRSSLLSFLFADYFADEQRYQAHLVRVLNELSRTVDSFSVSKNDELESGLIGLEKKLRSEREEGLQALREKVGALESSSAQLEDRIETLDAVSKGLEHIVSKLSTSAAIQSPLAEEKSGEPIEEAVDYSYLLLENRFRGSEELIRERLLHYTEVFESVPGPVLEIGSGRGELQELFREASIESYGVELDQAMVELSTEKELNVRLENGITHLASLSEESLGGVIAIQVVEHLQQDSLKELIELCRTRVKKGGKVVFETINTESLVALSHNYFRDPTHVWPLHPQTLRFIVELAGLKVLEVRKLSSYSQEAVLQELPIESYMTPRWIQTVETLNRNIRQLNKLLYDHQDYCIIAERP